MKLGSGMTFQWMLEIPILTLMALKKYLSIYLSGFIETKILFINSTSRNMLKQPCTIIIPPKKQSGSFLKILSQPGPILHPESYQG